MTTVAKPKVTAAGVRRDVEGIVGALLDYLDGPLCCAACGCLCRPSETCPGCRARRMVAGRS